MGYCYLYKRGGGGSGGGAVGTEMTAIGSVIALTNSLQRPLKGLRIFGRTTQNGTPTPTAPVPLVSPGDDGNLSVIVARKNLVNVNFVEKTDRGVTFTPGEKGGVNLSGAVTQGYPFMNVGKVFLVAGIDYYVSLSGNILQKMGLRLIDRSVSPNVTAAAAASTFTAKATGWYNFEITTNPGFEGQTTVYPMVELGKAATEHEQYDGQSATLSTPNGLPGIPVASGGNNTDTSGLQWVCDEVDSGTGERVQRTQLYSFTGNEEVSAPYWDATGFYYNISNYGYPAPINGSDLVTTPCSHTTGRGALVQGTLFFRNIGSFANQSEAKAWLKAQHDAGTPFTVLYQLATPIRTPLSAEELAAYAALHTYAPNTTIYNDGGAEMEVKYMSGG